METISKDDYELSLPSQTAGGSLDQDEEWCEIEIDGESQRIRLHDYAAIYQIPGLYERLFAESLACDSPRVVTDLLRCELDAVSADPGELTALDFGAGNGLVGECLQEAGVSQIVGVDLLEEARDAAYRDRPDVYDDYHALDLTAMEPEEREELQAHDFNLMTCVAALGFGDVPPVAFAEAFNLVSAPGWIAVNLRDRFLEERDPTGFGGLIARMLRQGLLTERARVRYQHRVSVTGEPLHYLALVAEKHDDVPMRWAQSA